MLEHAGCGGGHAISGKDRYNCTKSKKLRPIDKLGAACCGSSKTTTPL